MKTTALAGSFGMLGMLAAIAACAAGSADARDTLSSAPRLRYVTARLDARKCASPLCGGYFVRDVNGTHEEYVASLDFSPLDLDEAAREDARSAVDDLVLRGAIGEADPRWGTHTFVVHDLYRGLSGTKPGAADTFFVVNNREPPIRCITAPCDNEVATEIGSASSTSFTTLSVDAAALPWVQKDWLASRIESHSAIVSAHFEKGQQFPGGFERVLAVSRVYLRLPDVPGPCSNVAHPPCGEGMIAAMKRSADRCMIYDSCVERGICPQFIPACAPGYGLVSWPSAPSGCPAFACDPAFVTR